MFHMKLLLDFIFISNVNNIINFYFIRKVLKIKRKYLKRLNWGHLATESVCKQSSRDTHVGRIPLVFFHSNVTFVNLHLLRKETWKHMF